MHEIIHVPQPLLPPYTEKQPVTGKLSACTQYPYYGCQWRFCTEHYNDVIMDAVASQITSLTIVYLTVYSGADQRKFQSSASLAFVRGIHRWPVNFPHKRPVTRKRFPFDDVIMNTFIRSTLQLCSRYLLCLQMLYIYIYISMTTTSVDAVLTYFIQENCTRFLQISWVLLWV